LLFKMVNVSKFAYRCNSWHDTHVMQHSASSTHITIIR
jgi:hypothetical protein